nr:MAG TPA: hypothetical protein [Caudoviricetes sp.]
MIANYIFTRFPLILPCYFAIIYIVRAISVVSIAQ